MQFFYDGQIRRYLTQTIRVLSNFVVKYGDGTLVRVPVMYGDSDRQVGSIISQNSANAVASVPRIAVYISGLDIDHSRLGDASYVGKLNFRERDIQVDNGQQTYNQAQGKNYTVERLMPTPFKLSMKCDIWSSSTEQKLQILEQIMVLFNPSLEIQTTDNYIDWTSLSVVYQDGLTFSSRTVPMGSGNPIDIMSWKFQMPIWLSSSIKVKKLGVIHKIIASIFQGNAISDMKDDHLLIGTRQKITPYGYKLLLIGNSLQILPANENLSSGAASLDLPPNPDTTGPYWTSVLNVYGTVKPGISQIWLQNPYMDTEIVGTIAFNPNDDRLLIFNIDGDTLPQNTLPAVDSIINPMVKGPGIGLPNAANGQRYLIVEAIGDPTHSSVSTAWGNLYANANDIIQFDGTNWHVAFDSTAYGPVEYVTNLTSGVQYRFAEGEWMKAYEGYYDQGDYSIVI